MTAATLQACGHWILDEWGFGDRSRQPPADPVNALLKWGYGVLSARIFTIAVQAGFDPYLGFFHATEPYRPNLVLDLMEEFRPTIVDQAVIAALHSGLLTADDFELLPDRMGVWLGKMGKKVFLAQLDRQFQKRVQYAP